MRAPDSVEIAMSINKILGTKSKIDTASVASNDLSPCAARWHKESVRR
jgi:hypothetical protein